MDKIWKQTNFKKNSKTYRSYHRNHFLGIGKPEQLKYDLSGKWSRRINEEHRFVYEIEENYLKVFSLKGHYE